MDKSNHPELSCEEYNAIEKYALDQWPDMADWLQEIWLFVVPDEYGFDDFRRVGTNEEIVPGLFIGHVHDCGQVIVRRRLHESDIR